MGKTIKADGIPSGSDPGGRTGARKIASILERRTYDRNKTKANLTSTLQSATPDQIAVPVTKQRKRMRSASITEQIDIIIRKIGAGH